MADPSPLFPPSLLDSLVSASAPATAPPPTSSSALSSFSLPPGYAIRPLRASDFHNGMLDVLRVLTTVGDVTEASFGTRLEYMRSVNAIGTEAPAKKGTYFVLVITDDKEKVVGTGAVIVERKFIHELGMVGHIEDIAVAKDQQGKKLGLRIIQALDHVAKEVGCYKTILDCSEANEGFYVKCGYKRAGLEMAHYYN